MDDRAAAWRLCLALTAAGFAVCGVIFTYGAEPRRRSGSIRIIFATAYDDVETTTRIRALHLQCDMTVSVSLSAQDVEAALIRALETGSDA